MSKPFPTADEGGDDLTLPPPSYLEATHTGSSFTTTTNTTSPIPTSATSNGTLPSSLTDYFTSPIATHLASLPSRIRESQQARVNEQAARDLDVVTQLVGPIEIFLRDLGTISSRGPPPRAELTLVPAAAVPRGWALSGAAERRREGEVVQLVRVEDPTAVSDTKGKGGSSNPEKGGFAPTGPALASASALTTDEDDDGYNPSGARAAGFDEWGRFDADDEFLTSSYAPSTAPAPANWYYFRDEGMARRLAGYLQPRAAVHVERRQIQQAVVDGKKAAREEKAGGWRWGRKKSEASSSSATPVASPSQMTSSPAVLVVDQDDRVNMTVRAEEVTFRRENDFGIWESRTGYGIVVTVTVKRS